DNLLRSYLIYLLSQKHNIIAELVMQDYVIGTSLKQALLSDMVILTQLLTMLPSSFLDSVILDDYTPSVNNHNQAFNSLYHNIKNSLSTITPESLSQILIEHYQTYGIGDLSNYKAFRWDKEKTLLGIKNFDKITFNDLVGYERQKNILLANTLAFVNKKPANNVLLIGSRGTGKSSSVKALANLYFTEGLRLLEISKAQLCQLPEIMDYLRNTNKRFIIFLDDLSFEDYEVEYKYLKSIIEGGVEAKPDNVLIYATSNRRHLIKETWDDRPEHNEIHTNDSINEKISLSDRFGITLTYLSPNQEEYLDIVFALAKKHNIVTSDLRQEALKWEMSHSGRSGRVAKQFIDNLLGHN
ncbi:MAG: ATP-binding protein, partial [Negativicutes bacterium]|nr:ATP-binding protein [Negativicutes bacterium]